MRRTIFILALMVAGCGGGTHSDGSLGFKAKSASIPLYSGQEIQTERVVVQISDADDTCEWTRDGTEEHTLLVLEFTRGSASPLGDHLARDRSVSMEKVKPHQSVTLFGPVWNGWMRLEEYDPGRFASGLFELEFEGGRLSGEFEAEACLQSAP